jgi:hypothetical protein
MDTHEINSLVEKLCNAIDHYINPYSANERFKYIKVNLHLAGSELTVLEKTVREFKG